MPGPGRCALLLQRIAQGAPFATAFRQLDVLIPITSQCTLADPMAAVMADRAAILARTGAAELAWCFAFPYADFPGCGPALAAYAATQADADATADALLAAVEAREYEFHLDVVPAAVAVAKALRDAGPGGPVVIADTQDNPGGGRSRRHHRAAGGIAGPGRAWGRAVPYQRRSQRRGLPCGGRGGGGVTNPRRQVGRSALAGAGRGCCG